MPKNTEVCILFHGDSWSTFYFTGQDFIFSLKVHDVHCGYPECILGLIDFGKFYYRGA